MRKRLSVGETKQMRLVAGVLLALVALLTVIRYWLRGYPTGTPIGLILVAATAVVFLLSLVWPGPLAPAFRCWMVVARAIGWFNARLLLSLVFYCMFTPIGLVMRLMRRDPLQRQFNPDKISFWVLKEKSKDGLERYTRQF
ncbi:MAG TPA: SxtJ family membrane protein [bacterium]|nr:SxtJ family membrane protein [bacterium]